MIKYSRNHLILHIVLLVIVIFLPSCTAFKAIKLVNSGDIVPNDYMESVVPFTLKGHPMLIKAKLNNSPKEYVFMLDTGALNIVSKEVSNELGLPKGIDVQASGSGGKSKTIELVQLNRVIVGNMEVRDCATGVTDLSKLFPPNIAGILGSNFLKHFKITIDYQKEEVTFSRDTQPITTDSTKIKIPFKTDMKNGFAPIVDCELEGGIKTTAIIDTGHPQIVALSLSMIKKTDTFKKGDIVTAIGGMSGGMFGKEEESLALRISEMQIGDIKLVDIPVISHAAKTGDVLLGIKFLEKFLVTLNYPAKEMILEPYDIPFETNIPTYGFALTKEGKRTLVSGVVENSSAANIGIQSGDEILKINSRDVTTLSLIELLAGSLDKDINSLEIEFMKDKEMKKAIIHKEMLLPVL